MFKIVFLGSGDLACGVLQGLMASRHQIVGVLFWEQLSKASLGLRLKRRLVPDAVTLAKSCKLPLLPAVKANSPEFAQTVAALEPDILLVAGWGEILTEAVIALPKLACVNVHPSLLPRHRGFNPISSVLRAGESQSGVTFHYLTRSIDAGDVLLQSTLPVFPDDNGDSLRRKIAFRAKETVVEALERITRQDFVPIKQDESRACYRPRLKFEDAKIDWHQSAQFIHDQIRGCYPWIKCRAVHRGRTLLVARSEIVELYSKCRTPGKILHKSGVQFVVATGDPERALLVSKVHLANPLSALQDKLYLARRIREGDCLD